MVETTMTVDSLTILQMCPNRVLEYKRVKAKNLGRREFTFRDFFRLFCKVFSRFLWALAFVSVH